jgi:hypothetical protein
VVLSEAVSDADLAGLRGEKTAVSATGRSIVPPHLGMAAPASCLTALATVGPDAWGKCPVVDQYRIRDATQSTREIRLYTRKAG